VFERAWRRIRTRIQNACSKRIFMVKHLFIVQEEIHEMMAVQYIHL